jgi:hypothetical protein
MAAPHPTTRTVQPPPDLPSLTDASGKVSADTLSSYLRNFALWCRHGFADKISASTAQPGVLLAAYDTPAGQPPKVFMIRVNGAGVVSAVAVPLGGGP